METMQLWPLERVLRIGRMVYDEFCAGKQEI
jgi:hypothetical protein